MTFDELLAKIDRADIPYNVRIMSDSGWECGPSDCSRAFYNKERNILVFTQEDCTGDYVDDERWHEI